MFNKKANQLDRALSSESQSPEQLEQQLSESEEVQSLYRLAKKLESAPEVQPSARFRLAARSRLLAKLPEQTPVTFMDRLRLHWQTFTPLHKRRAAMTWLVVVITLITVLAGGGGVAYASTDALPGDGLYPVKMTLEAAQLGLTDDQGDFGLHMAYADRRLDEVRMLINQGRFEDVPEAAAGYETHLAQLERYRNEAGPLGEANGEMLAEQLRTRLEAHARILGDLGEGVPPELQQQIRMMNQIRQEVQHEGPPEDAGPNGDGPPEEAGPKSENAPEEAGPNGDGPPEDAGPAGEGRPEDVPPGTGEGDGTGPHGNGGPNQGSGEGEGNGTPSGPGEGGGAGEGNGNKGG